MPPKSKAVWDDEKDKLLLKLLLKQIKAGKRSDNGFKKEAWVQITADFNSVFSPGCEREQVKTRVFALKKKLDVFQKLCENSGFGWDSERKIPTAPDDVWDTYIQYHKDAKQFRHRTLQHHDMLYEIFSKSVATGLFASATTQSQSSASSSTQPVSTEDFENQYTDIDGEKSDYDDPLHISESRHSTPIPMFSRKRLRTETESPPSISAQTYNTTVKKPRTATHAAAEGLNELAKAFKEAKQIRAPPPITKLEQALDKMTEFVEEGKWSEEDYMLAYEIMLKDDRHAIFFCSAPEHIKLGWVKKKKSVSDTIDRVENTAEGV